MVNNVDDITTSHIWKVYHLELQIFSLLLKELENSEKLLKMLLYLTYVLQAPIDPSHGS